MNDLSQYALQERRLPGWLGQNFHAVDMEKAFAERVRGWLAHLDLDQWAPDPDALKIRVIETGERLRSAGDASFLGLADSGSNICLLIRPGDYVTLVHELMHVLPDIQGSMLADEPGAFAMGIHCGSDLEGELNKLFGSDSYSSGQKRNGRIACEALLVMGKAVFPVLAQIKSSTSTPQFLDQLRVRIRDFQQEISRRGMSGVEYLREYHGLPAAVGGRLMEASGEDDQSIVTSTSDVKRNYIFASKALAGFYHVNLRYDLAESFRRLEQHFADQEALTLAKTLCEGSREVYALTLEFGLPLPVICALTEYMLINGAERGIEYARGVPDLLRLCGRKGRRGAEFLAHALANPGLFDILTLGNWAEALLKVFQEEPDVCHEMIRLIQSIQWRHRVKESSQSRPFAHIALRDGRFQSMRSVEKAEILVAGALLFSLPNPLKLELGFSKSNLRYIDCSSATVALVDRMLELSNDHFDSLGAANPSDLARKILNRARELESRLQLPEPQAIINLDQQDSGHPWSSDNPEHENRLRGWWQDVKDGFMTEPEFHERRNRLTGG